MCFRSERLPFFETFYCYINGRLNKGVVLFQIPSDSQRYSAQALNSLSFSHESQLVLRWREGGLIDGVLSGQTGALVNTSILSCSRVGQCVCVLCPSLSTTWLGCLKKRPSLVTASQRAKTPTHPSFSISIPAGRLISTRAH